MVKTNKETGTKNYKKAEIYIQEYSTVTLLTLSAFLSYSIYLFTNSEYIVPLAGKNNEIWLCKVVCRNAHSTSG